GSLRRARSLANVRSSSAPASRLNPTTSAARIAASFRDSVMSVPQVSRRNTSAREVLNLMSRAGLISRVGTSAPSRSCRRRTPPAVGRLGLAGIGADGVAIAGQLGKALSGLVGRHRSVIDLAAYRPLEQGRVDEGGFGM